jgi:hypothetical protein
MIKKTVEFTDLDGNQRSVDCYFHLFTKEAALLREGAEKGDLAEFLKTTVPSGDAEKIMDEFEKILGRTYGVRNPDATFELDPDGWKKFTRSQAYNALLTELLISPKAMSEFIVGLLPAEIIDQSQLKKIAQDAEKDMQRILDEANRPVQDVGLPEPEPVKESAFPGDENESRYREMSRDELLAELNRQKGLARG